MADSNISSLAFIESGPTNAGIDKSIDQTYRPLTNNISNGAVVGDVTFEFSTGQDEWVQMSKCYLGVDYTLAGNFSWNLQAVAPALFARAQFFIEGNRITQSNNYTQDYHISNRLQYSSEYNKQNNDINFKRSAKRVPIAAVSPAAPGDAIVFTEAVDGQTVPTAGKYKSIDNLAALFFKLEDLMLPPNCHYKLTLTAESNEDFIQKVGLIDTRVANRTGTIAINNLYMNIHTVRRTSRPEGDFTIRIMNIESNISNVNAQQFLQQYQVSHRMKKVGVAFQSVIHRTEAQAKVFATNYLNFDETKGTLQNLQFKAGSLNLPTTAYNFEWGYMDAFKAYLASCGKYNDGLVGETYEEWIRQGKIYIQDVVKGDGDLSTNLQIETNFTNANVAGHVYMITFQINEFIIPFTWEQNGLIPTFKYA